MNKTLCPSFKSCASCILDGPYQSQKALKIKRTKELLGRFYDGQIEYFSSKQSGFRARAELRLWHDERGAHYAMNGADNKPVIIQSCAILDAKIAALMPRLLKELNANDALRHKIFGVEFVTSSEEICVILLYHKDILSINSELENLANALKISLIARSRGKMLVFGESLLNEKLNINGSEYAYKISFDGFIQPNRAMNEKMIEYACNAVINAHKPRRDFLELYCGHGNFTIPLSQHFNKTLATEISKASIALATQNAGLNKASNISFLRMSADELMDAFKGTREYNRLKNIELKSYDFSHILIDPPRAGASASVLDFIKNYANIIDVSSGQATLARDLLILSKTHRVDKLALFDQFVHTNHIESIVSLSAKI